MGPTVALFGGSLREQLALLALPPELLLRCSVWGSSVILSNHMSSLVVSGTLREGYKECVLFARFWAKLPCV